MTDGIENLEDLMLYADTVGNSPHVSSFGWGSVLVWVIILVALVTLYVIGGIRNKKRYGKWLRADMAYFRGIARGFTAFFATFMGVPVPEAFVDSSDGAYADLSRDVVDDCVQWAWESLEQMGLTYKGAYKWRVFDCEDFALAMKLMCTVYYAEQYAHPNKGAPFALFGYTKGNGSKHVCLKAIANGKAVYYEVYPDYAGELKLTSGEIKSRDLELF